MPFLKRDQYVDEIIHHKTVIVRREERGEREREREREREKANKLTQNSDNIR